MAALASDPFTVYGVDFTSAPRHAKPITIAVGRLQGQSFALDAIELAHDFAAFEALLARPGPWIAGIDAPFGLPREAVRDLAWPGEWPALVRHCESLGKVAFRAALDTYRESRPFGHRYAHRATDHPAGSHSPLKLVNPPVGLMFLAAAPRLLAAGVSIPGIHAGDPARIAVEAYPGFTARAIVSGSYKSDDRAKQTPERHRLRANIVSTLVTDGGYDGLRLVAHCSLLATIARDPSGDRLDAVLAAMQAAWSLGHRDSHFGLPPALDPIEGWIATVPFTALKTPA